MPATGFIGPMTPPIKGFFGPYRFLSNFWAAELEYEGLLFPTSEAAYQAAKTLDFQLRLYIAKLDTPNDAKRAGRKLDVRPDWSEVKLRVMEEVVWAKFSQNLHLKRELLNTGDAELIETNHWSDVFWGTCMNGNGLNHLGKILMSVRDRLAM